MPRRTVATGRASDPESFERAEYSRTMASWELLLSLSLRSAKRAAMIAVIALVVAATVARDHGWPSEGYSRSYFVVAIDHATPAYAVDFGDEGFHPNSGPTSRGYYALVAIAGYEIRVAINRVGCLSCTCLWLPISVPMTWPSEGIVDEP
jgi:hypothetical protein